MAALVVAVLLVVSAIDLVVGDSGTDPTAQDQELVETAARRLSHQAIADAWSEIRRGNAAPLDAIKEQVPLGFRAAHDRGDSVILTFGGTRGGCVDLVSSPATMTVRGRRC